MLRGHQAEEEEEEEVEEEVRLRSSILPASSRWCTCQTNEEREDDVRGCGRKVYG